MSQTNMLICNCNKCTTKNERTRTKIPDAFFYAQRKVINIEHSATDPRYGYCTGYCKIPKR